MLVNERFVNRLFRRQQTNTGDVRDFILGAHVVGTQTTTSDVTVDFQENPRVAQARIRLLGFTSSDTIGLTKMAVVGVCGQHRFLATKPVLFDGARLLTGRADAVVDPHNFTRGVRSPATGFPLLGPLVDQIVYSRAEARRPEAEAIAAERLKQRVLPEFDRNIDAELGRANAKLKSWIRPQLAKLKLNPDSMLFTSTDQHLVMNVRFGIARPDTRSPAAASPGTTVLIHESLLNELINRAGAGGMLVSDRRLAKLLARVQGGGDPSLRPEESANPSLTFRLAQREPIRVSLVRGALRIDLNASVTSTAGDRLPQSVIKFVVESELTDEAVVFRTSSVQVDVPPGAGHEATAETVRRRLISMLQPVRLSRSRRLPEINGRRLSVRLSEVEANAGWLRIVIQ